MPKKKSNYYIVKNKNNYLAGAFPYTKDGKEKARLWADELTEKRREKYQIFKM
jgi:hypothetical protein